jgi:hypothetical protein
LFLIAEDIECLLAIFPSKENLSREYRNMLCQQLINLPSFEAEEQIRHVEVLTTKFGESLMANTKVMMKDLSDSRRLFNAYTQKTCDNIFSSLVISSLFWPKLTESTFMAPAFVQRYYILR